MISIGARVVSHAFVSEVHTAALTRYCLLMANSWWHPSGRWIYSELWYWHFQNHDCKHFSAFPPYRSLPSRRCTSFYDLLGNVFLARVWFFVLFVLNRVYNFARVCLNCKVKQGIACTIELICLMNLFVLQVFKSNDYDHKFLNCNFQQMSLKQVRLHFVVCPKQGNEIEGTVSHPLFVLKISYPKQSLRVSNPRRLTSTQILVEHRPTHQGLTVPNLKWITHQPTYTKIA